MRYLRRVEISVSVRRLIAERMLIDVKLFRIAPH